MTPRKSLTSRLQAILRRNSRLGRPFTEEDRRVAAVCFRVAKWVEGKGKRFV